MSNVTFESALVKSQKNNNTSANASNQGSSTKTESGIDFKNDTVLLAARQELTAAEETEAVKTSAYNTELMDEMHVENTSENLLAQYQQAYENYLTAQTVASGMYENVASVGAQVTQSEATVADYETKLAASEAKIADYESTIAGYKAQRDAEISAKLDVINGHQNERNQAEWELSNLQTTRSAKESEKTNKESTRSEKSSKYSANSSRISALDGEIAALQAQLNAEGITEEETASINAQITEKQNEKSRLETENATLNAEIEALNTEIEALNTEIESLGGSISDKEGNISAINRDINTAEQELAQIENRWNSEISAVEVQLAAEYAVHAGLVAQTTFEKTNLADLKAQEKYARDQYTNSMLSVSSSKRIMDELEKKLEKGEIELTRVTEKTEVASDENDVAKEETEEKREAYNKTEATVKNQYSQKEEKDKLNILF